mmetsp:Transcript_968/g.2372  ORF Transcript_968/g.2372 Transcript_968/m.2372 type:complete len:265 (-) Transcript_968:1816-2610(-)
MDTRPIGIFDSGIGGLTVARAVKDLLPQEALIYFGDTAYLPYGDKSLATIRTRVVKICDILLQARCKVILIACNSAAAAAQDLVTAHVGRQAVVLNVIDPMINYIGQRFQGQSIGLIGTHQTVRSGMYEKKLHSLNRGIQLEALATPLLAPMIEAAWGQGIRPNIIYHYLQHPCLQKIRALILGCTHYHVIKVQIQAFYQYKLAIVDATTMIATYLQHCMAHRRLLSPRLETKDHLIVSDLTPTFEKAAHFFFGQKVHLTQQMA